jgi:hypothetical protein
MVQLEKVFRSVVVININLALVSSELVAVLEMSTCQFFEGLHAAGRMSKHVRDQLKQFKRIVVVLVFEGVDDTGQKWVAKGNPVSLLIVVLDSLCAHLCAVGG